MRDGDMRLKVSGDGMLEQVALWSGLVPTPVVEVFLGFVDLRRTRLLSIPEMLLTAKRP